MVIATNVKVFMLQQFRFPRSKSKRIKKKWWKDKLNWRESELKGVNVFSPPGLISLPKKAIGRDVKITYSHEASVSGA